MTALARARSLSVKRHSEGFRWDFAPRLLGMVFAFLVMFSAVGGAQNWALSLGGTATDFLRAMAPSPDGGFVFVGYTRSYGSGTPSQRNAWVAKVSSAGVVLWQRVYARGGDEDAASIGALPGGGYIVAMNVSASVGSMWLMKISEDGSVVWQRDYRPDGPFSGNIGNVAAAPTRDGGVIAAMKVSGSSGSMMILRLDSAGSLLWSRGFGVQNPISDVDIIEAPDGTFVFMASVYNSCGGGNVGTANGLLARISAAGDFLWRRGIGGSYDDYFENVDLMPDGGIVVAGISGPFSSSSRYGWVVKTDADGLVEWNHSYRGTQTGTGRRARPTPDGGVLFIGDALYSGPSLDSIFLQKFAVDGTLEWQRWYGTAAYDYGTDLAVQADGSTVVIGSIEVGGVPQADGFVARVDSAGAVGASCSITAPQSLTEGALTLLAPSTCGYTLIDFSPLVTIPSYSVTTSTSVPTEYCTACSADFAEPDPSCSSSIASLAGGADAQLNFCDDWEDWLTIFACPGYSYTLSTSALGVAADTILELYGSNCTDLLSSDDDSGEGLGSRLTYVASTDAQLQVRVRQKDATSGPGREYTLSLAEGTGSCELWAKAWGGGADDEPAAAIQSAGGGFLVVGRTASFGGGASAAWAAHFDSSGQVLWERAYGGGGSERFLAVTEVGGGYVAVGENTAWAAGGVDGWVVRLAADGSVLWERALGGAGVDSLAAVLLAADGSIVAVGSTTSAGVGGSDGWMVRLDASGNLLGQGVAGEIQDDVLSAVAETIYGFVAIGTIRPAGGGGADGWWLLFDEACVPYFDRNIGGAGDDALAALAIDELGNCWVAGTTTSFGAGGGDAFVAKLSFFGGVIAARSLGGAGSDGFRALGRSANGGMAVAGYSDSLGPDRDLWFADFDAALGVRRERRYATAAGVESATALVATRDGSFFVAGSTNGVGAGGDDWWLIRTDGEGAVGNCPQSSAVTSSAATINPYSGYLLSFFGFPALSSGPTTASVVTSSGTNAATCAGCTASVPAPQQLTLDALDCLGPLSSSPHAPVLAWSNVSGEFGYRWEVFSGSSCEGTLVAFGSESANVAFGGPATALAAGVYVWRVRALGDGRTICDSPWSCGCSFSIVCPQVPTPIQATVESTGCSLLPTTSNRSPTLGWNDVAGESGYEWEVFAGADCSGTAVAAGTMPAGVVTATLASALPSGLYTWRVRALGNGVTSCHGNWTCGCPFRIRLPTTDLRLFAGPPSPGDLDGPALLASFRSPSGIAADSSGDLTVADTGNSTIRRISTGGAVSTLAGLSRLTGTVDGVGGNARFNSPGSVAVDGTGVVYVADTSNHTIRKIATDGSVAVFAGLPGTSGTTNGTGTAARFFQPTQLAIDGSGNLYVADRGNHGIRRVTPAGVVTTLAGWLGVSGAVDATGTSARFSSPNGIVFDGSTYLYVSDTGNHAIRRVSLAGVVTTVAGTMGSQGTTDAGGAAARFRFPQQMARDGVGRLYVADTGNHTIRQIVIAGFAVTTPVGLAGTSGWADGVGNAATFRSPSGVTALADGTLYVTDTGNHGLRLVTPARVVSTFAAKPGGPGSADGSGFAARFSGPRGMAVDPAGNVYVADSFNHTIRRISAAGEVTTLAGLAGISGTADGTGSAARFNSPADIAIDNWGNLFVADRQNSAIRKISPAGAVTTAAGLPGTAGVSNGTGTAARFNLPSGIAFDGVDSFYIADTSNHAIRRMTQGGVVTTYAGLIGTSGSTNGALLSARFNQPAGIAVGPGSNPTIWIADTGNYVIRSISFGSVSTPAGSAGATGYVDATGAAARFAYPISIATDSGGTVFVADSNNGVLRSVSGAGVVTTVAGSASRGNREGSGASARFESPYAVEAAPDGRIHVTDLNNHNVVRGAVSIADLATLDSASGTVGLARQLDTLPQQASTWNWTLIRRPTASSASFSDPSIRNPTLIPDRGDIWTMRLEATHPLGSSVSVVSLAGNPCPAVTSSPSSRSACPGTSTTFDVQAAGQAPLSYQWQKDLVPIGGATSPSLTISPVGAPDAASYTCVVTNACGSSTSIAAALTVPLLETPVQLSVDSESCPESRAHTTPILAWQDVSAEASYEWQVWDGFGCTGAVVASGTSPSDTPTASVASGLAAGSYSWQVRAIGNGGSSCTGSWSCGCPFLVQAPREPSRAGSAYPLRLEKSPPGLVVEKIGNATAYDVYVDGFGSWYSPTVGEGSVCRVVAWTDRGDGTIFLPFDLPDLSWVVVGASNALGSSPVGQDSDGVELSTMGSWPTCSLGP